MVLAFNRLTTFHFSKLEVPSKWVGDPNICLWNGCKDGNGQRTMTPAQMVGGMRSPWREGMCVPSHPLHIRGTEQVVLISGFLNLSSFKMPFFPLNSTLDVNGVRSAVFLMVWHVGSQKLSATICFCCPHPWPALGSCILCQWLEEQARVLPVHEVFLMVARHMYYLRS